MIYTESLAQEYLNLANFFYEQNMMEKAIKCYKKVIKLEPQWALGYNSLGSILTTKGELDEAKGYLKKALELEPNAAEIYWNTAHVLSRQALLDEAKANWQKAVDLKPDISKEDGSPTWEYFSNAWPTTGDRAKSYDTQDRIDKLRKNWDSFLAKYKGTKPLGSLGENFSSANPNYAEKNIFMTYAYILGLASHKKEKISILDWGGVVAIITSSVKLYFQKYNWIITLKNCLWFVKQVESYYQRSVGTKTKKGALNEVTTWCWSAVPYNTLKIGSQCCIN